MASISKRPDGRWRARYRDANGKEHAKHFDRKADAQRWVDEITAAIVTGQYVDPNAGKTTFKEYATGWEASQVTGEAQRRIVDNALRVHLIPALGARPVASIKRADVQGFVKQLDLRLGPGSVRNVFEVLGRVLSAAVDDRVIASSPCQRISLPTETRLEVVPPTAEQVKALAEAISPRYRAAVVTLAGSGLRIGELLGLRTGDVDFLRRSVRVERQRRQNGSLGPPKTARSVRIVPLGRVVTDELAAHLAAHPSEEWLFTTAQGEPLSYRAWKAAWCIANTRVGLKVDTHDLRHAFASALISGGASAKQVQTVLGHANAAITLRVYSHLWPGDEDRTRSIVDAAFDVLRTRCGPNTPAADKTAGQRG